MNDGELPQRLMETQPVYKKVVFKTKVDKNQCDKKRVYIPVKTKQLLYQRSDGCCEFISESGVKCQSRFKLQIDHLQPIALLGNSEIENLRHLCSNHNLLAASQMGIGYETVLSNFPNNKARI